jgi:hypothetical protein
MSVAPAVEATTTDVIFWARNVFALETPQIQQDDAEARFFADSLPNREADAYRENPTLQSVVKLLAVMVRLGGSPNQSDADLFLNSVSILTLLSHRLWEDLGGEGDPEEYAKRLERGMQKRLTGATRPVKGKD